MNKDRQRNELEINVEYPIKLQKIASELPIFVERMKVEKVRDRKMYALHTENLNQTLKPGLKLKKCTSGC